MINNKEPDYCEVTNARERRVEATGSTAKLAALPNPPEATDTAFCSAGLTAVSGKGGENSNPQTENSPSCLPDVYWCDCCGDTEVDWMDKYCPDCKRHFDEEANHVWPSAEQVERDRRDHEYLDSKGETSDG